MAELGRHTSDRRGTEAHARAETGLKRLATLNLIGTRVTDEGLMDLARAKTGLAGLATLYLVDTPVTEAGIAALKARWPGVAVIR